MRYLFAAVSLASVTTMSGCDPRTKPAAKPTEILHVVLVKLNDPEKAGALRRDTFNRLGHSGWGRSLVTGTALHLDRPEVDADYDEAFVFCFLNREEYEEYLSSKEHLGLLNEWKPRIKTLRVYDIQVNKP